MYPSMNPTAGPSVAGGGYQQQLAELVKRLMAKRGGGRGMGMAGLGAGGRGASGFPGRGRAFDNFGQGPSTMPVLPPPFRLGENPGGNPVGPPIGFPPGGSPPGGGPPGESPFGPIGPGGPEPDFGPPPDPISFVGDVRDPVYFPQLPPNLIQNQLPYLPFAPGGGGGFRAY